VLFNSFPFLLAFLPLVAVAYFLVEDGRRLGCRPNQFPDAFHTDAACSLRVRDRLDEAARRAD